MRYLFFSTFVAIAALGDVTGIAQATPTVLDSRSDYVDVHVNGKHFYGLHLDHQISIDGKLSWECSAVVLCPWSERPHFSIKLQGDTTVVTINGQDYRVKGRYVCETDGKGSFLTLYPGEIAPAAYDDREALQKAIVVSLSKTNKDGG